MTTVAQKVPAWLGLNVAALAASLAHGFIDFHLWGLAPALRSCHHCKQVISS
jgi:hypothetical protein